MEIVMIVLFGISLVCVISLFAIKNWEVKRNRILMPVLRNRADNEALRLKDHLLRVRVDVARVVPIALVYTRFLVHKGALSVAAMARNSERRAHRLAEIVSYKRTHVPRETTSEFLRKVSEHKSENGLDS